MHNVGNYTIHPITAALTGIALVTLQLPELENLGILIVRINCRIFIRGTLCANWLPSLLPSFLSRLSQMLQLNGIIQVRKTLGKLSFFAFETLRISLRASFASFADALAFEDKDIKYFL